MEPTELTLELIDVPVSDLDRAKRFYEEGCGFTVDFDMQPAPGIRMVQLTPPGSRCSVALTSSVFPRPNGQPTPEPGTVHGLQLCTTDIAATRAALVAGGVDVSEVMHTGENGWVEGPGREWNSFVFFRDPDGNSWAVQEAPKPLSER
ncbi:VOC family protein [Streptomyces sp. NPDC048057]|uniref:VOC family protein n=1 Tax=Streptomyces sp. NPDC048057 TaxID=3155628 RepID=UPI0033FE7887